MELQFSFSIIISLILSLLFLFKLVSSTCKSANLFTKSKMPPGPWKLPVIGNFHHLIGSLEKPHHGFRELAKKHGHLMHLQLGKMSVVVVSSRELATEVLKTHDLTFADRPDLYIRKIVPNPGRDIVTSRYGEYWRQMRKLCMLELLSTKRVRSFSSLLEQEASEVIASIHASAGSNINLTEMILSYTGNIICRAAFGGKRKDQLAFASLTNDIFLLAARFSLNQMFPSLSFLHVISGLKAKLLNIHEEADKILENIINEHIAQKTTSSDQYGEVAEPEKEDFVDVLLRLQKSGNLEDHITAEDVKAVIWDIFIAASETSSATITWAMAEMMRDPKVMEKAQVEIRETLKGKNRITEINIQELSYLKLVIKETLRLHPPIPLLLPRECRELCVIKGYEIPVGTILFVNAWALGRDPRYWNDHESFIPERFGDGAPIDFKGTNFEYTPFGAGRRICPGITLGWANMETLLAQLLYHFDWKLPDGIEPETLDMTEDFGATVRKKSNIIAVATPYIPPEM